MRYFKSSPVKLVDTNTSSSLSIFAVETNLGSVIGTLLSIGLMFLGFTSLGAAFVPGCPFRSAFSELMLFIFEKLQALSKWILGLCRCLSSSKSSEWLRWLWIGILTIFWLASDAAVAYATLKDSTWFSLFFFSSTIPIAYVSQLELAYKPQKYRILNLATCVFLFVTLLMFLAVWFKSWVIYTPICF